MGVLTVTECVGQCATKEIALAYDPDQPFTVIIEDGHMADAPEAHHIVGRLVAIAAAQKKGLEELSLAEMRAVEPRISEEVFAVLGVENSVRSRTSFGGTAPKNVRAQARLWLKRLKK